MDLSKLSSSIIASRVIEYGNVNDMVAALAYLVPDATDEEVEKFLNSASKHLTPDVKYTLVLVTSKGSEDPLFTSKFGTNVVEVFKV